MSHHRNPTRGEASGAHVPATGGAFPDVDQMRSVYQFIYRHVGNREEAEELTVRACTRAASQQTLGVSNRKRMASALREAARSVVEEHRARFYPITSESLPGGESGDQSVEPDVPPGGDGSTPELLQAVLAQLSLYERDL